MKRFVIDEIRRYVRSVLIMGDARDPGIADLPTTPDAGVLVRFRRAHEVKRDAGLVF